MNAWHGVCSGPAAAVSAIPHAGGRTSAILLAGSRTSFAFFSPCPATCCCCCRRCHQLAAFVLTTKKYQKIYLTLVLFWFLTHPPTTGVNDFFWAFCGPLVVPSTGNALARGTKKKK
jgi:hypothetical protein